MNNILSKDEFKHIINKVESYYDLVGELYDLNIDIINLNTLDVDVISLLDKMYNTDCVSYWCWECNFGSNENLMPMRAYKPNSDEIIYEINNSCLSWCPLANNHLLLNKLLSPESKSYGQL